VSSAADLVGQAQRLLAGGHPGAAIAACREALRIEPDLLPAHICMARARLPGDDFLTHLSRFHELLRPAVYLEIGVDAGRTLCLARRPTLAIGVDPEAPAGGAFATETRLVALESDAFFASGRADAELSGRAVELAFIDGLHHFEQALRDLAHVEGRSRRDSVVLLHDCLPLDAATASRERRTGFWSGDVWKILPILAEHRPDLDVFVIPAYPTGLAVVTRLDPGSRVLEERAAKIEAEWRDREWSDAGGNPMLPVIENDWEAVRRRLGSHRHPER
jgi:hypothetical protein